MKKNNKIFFLLIFIFIFSLFILNNSVKAYTIAELPNYNFILNEDKVYTDFSKIENFDINRYSKIYCINQSTVQSCYAITKETIEILSNTGNKIEFVNPSEDCIFYHIQYQFGQLGTKNSFSCNSNTMRFTTLVESISSNFNFPFYTETENDVINVLDFSLYIEFDDNEEETPTEPDKNIKITEVFNLIVDKSRNIINLITNNNSFLFFMVIPLAYLGFIFIYKIIKR